MSITINKNQEQFFISINKMNGHTFVMLGLYDKNKVKNVLCRVGKFMVKRKENWVCCNALFSKVDAKLCDEGVSKNEKNAKPISYQAYDITYKQYLQFIQILDSLQTPQNRFMCYRPQKDKPETDKELTLTLTNEIYYKPKAIKRIKQSISELRVGNTCRHSAVVLVEKTQHAPVSSLVSLCFLKNLPYKSQLDFGKPSDSIPFYVLPIPPTALKDLDQTKKDLLTKLYKRMEHMILLKPKAQETQDKFSCLKELYLNIKGPSAELSLNELLLSIQNWKKEHKDTLTVLRKTYFWDAFFTRQSSTMNLIAEIEQDIKKARIV